MSSSGTLKYLWKTNTPLLDLKILRTLKIFKMFEIQIPYVNTEQTEQTYYSERTFMKSHAIHFQFTERAHLTQLVLLPSHFFVCSKLEYSQFLELDPPVRVFMICVFVCIWKKAPLDLYIFSLSRSKQNNIIIKKPPSHFTSLMFQSEVRKIRTLRKTRFRKNCSCYE